MTTIKDFKLPDLGEGLEDGEIVAWRVEVGEEVELNQTVAEVETAKAVVEIPSPFAGRIVERLGDVGETIEVGSVFLRIETDVAAAEAASPEGEPPPSEAHASEAAPEQKPKASSTGLDADDEPQPLVGYGQRGGKTRRRRKAAAAGSTDGHQVLAKPPVRKLAKDLGVDLVTIAPGSGPGGVITRDDVQAAAAAEPAVAATAPPVAPTGAPPAVRPAPAPAPETRALPPLLAPAAGEKAVPGFRGRRPGEVEPIRAVRKRIVEKMETSRREIPEATCSRDADVTALWDLRTTLTEQAEADGFDVRITPFAFVLRAAVLALRRFPTLNARIDRTGGNNQAGEIQLLEHINLGFAADTDRGLVVPNIKDAHTKSTLQLALELRDLAAKARDGSVTPNELTGGTFTVNNYGAFGNDDGDPIINHPEAAILGVGAMRARPWVVDGAVVPRRVARFTLAFDHRICDGGEAGRFVTYVADLCEQPTRILLHS